MDNVLENDHTNKRFQIFLKYCVPASPGGPTPTNTVSSSSGSSSLYTSTVQPGPPGPSSANAVFPAHPHLQTSYPSSSHFASSLSAPSPPPHGSGCCPIPATSSSSPDWLMALQWNVGGLRARSAKLLHFISSHPVDLICVQDSNHNSSSSFRIRKFTALRSDRTHFRSDILSSDGCMQAVGPSFLSGRSYPFLNFLPPPLFASPLL